MGKVWERLLSGRRRLESLLGGILPRSDRGRRVLLVALLALSWWSTSQGLLALVSASNQTPSIGVQFVIYAVVSVLTILMSWSLRVVRLGQAGWLAPLYVTGYILLLTISVGFGFGFYWTHIESRAAATRTAMAAAEAVQQDFGAAFSRLDEGMAAISDLAALSAERANQEATTGASCGTASAPGAGPRYQLRMRDAATLGALHDRITKAQQRVIRGDSGANSALSIVSEGQFAAYSTDDARSLLRESRRALEQQRQTYESFRTGPSITAAITSLEARYQTGQGQIRVGDTEILCPDPEMDVALGQAAQALRALPPVSPIDFDVPLGADATIAAFTRLVNQVVPGRSAHSMVLSGRDFVPLGVALAVDLFILLLSLQEAQRPGQRSRRMTAEQLGSPEMLRRMSLGQSDRHRQATHADLLEHCFWWRNAYHLALPIVSPGEAPLTEAQSALSMLAMVLSDAGLLTPVQRRKQPQQILRRFRNKGGRNRMGREVFDVYRFAPNGLAEMTGFLVPEQGERPDQDGYDTNWRASIGSADKNGAARNPRIVESPDEADGEAFSTAARTPKPSAYWRALRPMAGGTTSTPKPPKKSS